MKKILLPLFLLLPIYAPAQFAVHDIENGIILVKQSGILNTQKLWMGQVILSKIPWATQIPTVPTYSTVPNTMGQMAQWRTVLMNGRGASGAWREATVQMSPQAAQVILRQFGLSSNQAAQAATVDAINAAATNNLALIGNARGYLQTSLPMIKNLQSSILSPVMSFNGPTQQMQYVAAGTAQANSVAVQNLQVNTGLLETVTALAKQVADANTADLNIEVKQQVTYQSQPTAAGGWARHVCQSPIGGSMNTVLLMKIACLLGLLVMSDRRLRDAHREDQHGTRCDTSRKEDRHRQDDGVGRHLCET